MDNKTKYPAFTHKTSWGEWVCVFLWKREGFHDVKCWHLLQALAGLECDTLLYTKGLGPSNRHMKTSICPSPQGQHKYEMTASMSHAFFPEPLTWIKTTKASLLTLMLARWLLYILFELVVSKLCEAGGKLLQHCIMRLAQWVQYVSSSPLIVVSVLQQTYHTAGDTPLHFANNRMGGTT